MKDKVRVTERGNIMVKVGTVDDVPISILFQKILKGDDIYYIVKPAKLVYNQSKNNFWYEFGDGVFLSRGEMEALIVALVEMIKK